MNRKRAVYFGFAGILAALFVALAATRRLNFDESLALRAGWLEVGGIDASPAFVMPWTLMLGGLSRWLSDPGDVLLASRLVTAATVLGALAYFLFRAGLRNERFAGALALSLLQGTFVAHGFEFRYDAAILVCTLLLAGALSTPAALSPRLAGIALAGLGLHHVKGLFLALVFAVWSIPRLRSNPRALRDLALFSLGTSVLWLAAIETLGLRSRFVETLTGFWDLAEGTTRVSPAEVLGRPILGDFAWWMVTLFILVAAVAAQRRTASSRPEESVLVVFAGVTLSFVFLHPHPWAYMLALPCPFLSALVARRWPERLTAGPSRRKWALAALVALLFQAAALQKSPLAPWTRGFAAERAPYVELLRRVQRQQRASDAVLDPSGLLFFVPPCTREWYVDTLFAEKVAEGKWMQELSHGIPATCSLAVVTGRLIHLPSRARDGLSTGFVAQPTGLALRADDLALASFADPIPGLPQRLENYW